MYKKNSKLKLSRVVYLIGKELVCHIKRYGFKSHHRRLDLIYLPLKSYSLKVEQSAHNGSDVGSNPTKSITTINNKYSLKVERRFVTSEIRSSNLLIYPFNN